MHSSKKDKIEARYDVEEEKSISSYASKIRDTFLDTINISSSSEFNCQTLDSSPKIKEVPPSNQDSVGVPLQLPVLTQQEHLSTLWSPSSHPHCHITSRPLCPSITSHPSLHQTSFDQSEIKSEGLHPTGFITFHPHNLYHTTDGTFQNNLNQTHSSPQESLPIKLYPILLCRGPSGEPINFYTAYQPCCNHHHHQPANISTSCGHHHHHHHHHNESDKHCPIHGYQTQHSHNSVGVTQQSLLTSSQQSSSSSTSVSITAVINCALTSSSSSTQTGINSSGVLKQDPPLTDRPNININYELDTPIKDKISVAMETPMENTNQPDDEHVLLLDEHVVSNGNQDVLAHDDDDDDDDEKEMTETHLEVLQGDDDDDDDDNDEVYPANHTPPERDSFQDQDEKLEQEDETERAKNQNEFVSGMAFTIDFGNDKDKPEITENWKKFVPYKIHAGIQERQDEQKRRRMSKELAAEEKKMEQMKKSRSHSGYMSEGHDASSVVSTDIEDASICSDFYFQRGPHYSSPKRIPAKDKRPTSSSKFSTPLNQTSSQNKKIIKSAPATKSTINSGIKQSLPTTSKSHLKNTKSADPRLVKGQKIEPIRSKQKLKSVELPQSLRASSHKHGGVESSFDANVEGTAYLIKKMLSDIPSSTSKSLGSPGIARRLKLGMKQARDAEEDDDDNDVDGRAKAPSESGTYTIDDDDEGEDGDDVGEVIKARKKIDEAFGVVYKLPVIDDQAPAKRTPSKKLVAGLMPKRKPNKINLDTSQDQMNVKESQEYEKAVSPINDKKYEQEVPMSSMEREDSFEKLMNETSSRLNALIDATSRVIRDAKFSMKPDGQTSSSTFVRPRKSTTSASIEEGSEEVSKDPSPDGLGFYTVLCDTPATRKTRSISSCETGSIGTKSPSDLHLSSHSVSQVYSGATVKDMTSVASRRGKSADVKSTTRETSKTRDIFNATPTASGNVDRKVAKKFVAPFAKSLSNVNQAGPRESTTFIRDVALIRDMVENTSGGSTRVRSALNRQPSATSSSSSVVQTSMRINRTFALRCSKAAPTGAAEVPGKSFSSSSARHPSRSRSVGNEEGARMKSRESSRSRLDSQKQSPSCQMVDASSRQRRNSGAAQERDVSAFTRRDGGRFSMRLDKPDTKSSDVNLPPTNAWQRRKNYDPRKSAELSRSRSSSTRRIDEECEKKDVGRSTSKGMSKVIPGKKLDKIAQMSHAVADNLNALAKNSDLERPASLKQLPVFTHDSPSSAFSTNTITKHRPIRSMGGGANSPQEVSPYDSILVDSIQQVSKKVKSLADVLIGRMREDPCFEDDSTSSSDLTTVWQSANPELAAILENLKRTELHLQEVHKTLFSDSVEPTSSSAGPLPISPHLARKTGFVPIDKPRAEEDVSEPAPRTTIRRGSGTSKQPLKTSELKKTFNTTSAPANKKKVMPFKPTNHNPLNSDEYY